jgi:hypothetical protein
MEKHAEKIEEAAKVNAQEIFEDMVGFSFSFNITVFCFVLLRCRVTRMPPFDC